MSLKHTAMARRAPEGVPRARHLRVVVDEEGAARRPGAAPGWVLIVTMVIGAVVYVLGGLLSRYGR